MFTYYKTTTKAISKYERKTAGMIYQYLRTTWQGTYRARWVPSSYVFGGRVVYSGSWQNDYVMEPKTEIATSDTTRTVIEITFTDGQTVQLLDTEEIYNSLEHINEIVTYSVCGFITSVNINDTRGNTTLYMTNDGMMMAIGVGSTAFCAIATGAMML